MSLWRTLLGEYLDQREAEERAGRYSRAIEASMRPVLGPVEGPRTPGQVGPMPAVYGQREVARTDPGFQGPMPRDERFDPQAFGLELLRQGDEAGINMIASQLGHEQALELARYNQGQQNERALLSQEGLMERFLMGQRADARQRAMEQQFPIETGSQPYINLVQDRSDLQALGSYSTRLDRLINDEGAISMLENDPDLVAEVQDWVTNMIQIQARMGGAGALQEADIEFYRQLSLDPVGFLKSAQLSGLRGKHRAFTERVNRGIERYNTLAGLTRDLSPLDRILTDSERMVSTAREQGLTLEGSAPPDPAPAPGPASPLVAGGRGGIRARQGPVQGPPAPPTQRGGRGGRGDYRQ